MAEELSPGRGAHGSVRLRSVDVFRGLTMAAMVIVNNPGDWNNVYTPLLHAPWHGWTPTDLVFPFFLFIVGVAITLSPTSAGNMGGVLRRSAVIFGLGLFLTGFPFFNLATWRIPGVLQRIAVCYLATIVIIRLTTPRDADVAAHMRRLAIVAVAIVSAYAAMMLWMPVPGGHAGDLSAEGNLGAWLDRALMRGHLWKPEWDPEGFLSTLPAIATTVMGVIAGQALRRARSLAEWRLGLAIGGVLCLALGALWDLWFPINKSLWTSSYVLFTGGIAALLLALCSLWSDEAVGGANRLRHVGSPSDPTKQRSSAVRPANRGGESGRSAGAKAEAPPLPKSAAPTWRVRTSEPFVALGRNAILLFVLSGLIGRLIGVVMVDAAAGVTVKSGIYSTLFEPIVSPRNASLLFALANLVLLYALLAWLHRRRLYWKV